MEKEIVNRVAKSGLISFDLEEYHHSGERLIYDLKQNLFMDMILKEKEFRAFLATHDWTQYEGKNIAITCSTDAIIPTWAYMLLTLQLEPYANCIVYGNLEDLEIKLYRQALKDVNFDDYRDTRVVVKGCSKVNVPTDIYIELSRKLQPLVKSLMFGEPCSTVPLYKKKREK